MKRPWRKPEVREASDDDLRRMADRLDLDSSGPIGEVKARIGNLMMREQHG